MTHSEIPLYESMQKTLQEYRKRVKTITVPSWWHKPKNVADLEAALKDFNKVQVRYSRDLVDLLATAPRKDDWDEIARLWEQFTEFELEINLQLEGMVIVE